MLQKNSNQNSAFKDTKTKNNEYSIKKNYDNNESNLNNNNFNNIDEKDNEDYKNNYMNIM